MKKWTVGMLVFLVALTFSGMAFADGGDKGLYSTKLTGEITVGKEGNLELRIVPAKGYKWNKDYPAKIKLPESKLVAFKKNVLKARDGDIKADAKNEKAGLATMACTGKASGTETLTAEASFSVCNDETCQVLRKRKVELSLVVK